MSILLCGCTIWTLTKQMEKKLDCNYTSMLWAVLNKFWGQYASKQQWYGQLPPITKTIQIRRTRHVGHCRRSRDELNSDILLWTPSQQKRQDDQLEPIYNRSVLIQDKVLMKFWERWMIETGGERKSGKSVLAAGNDVDDDNFDWSCWSFS